MRQPATPLIVSLVLALVVSAATAGDVPTILSGEFRGDSCAPVSAPDVPAACPVVAGFGFTADAFLATDRGADCCGLEGCGDCRVRFRVTFDPPFDAPPTVELGGTIACTLLEPPTVAQVLFVCGDFLPPNQVLITAIGLMTDPPTPTPTPTPKGLGASCETGAECESTFCRSSVCCERACDAPNEFCALPGSEGQCVAVALPTPSQTPSATPNTTPQPNGTACNLDTECTSGFCSDTVCCAERCDGAEQQCAVPGFEGQCLEILPTSTVTPTETRTGTPTASPSATPTVTPIRNPTFVACPGNCDLGPAVTVNELILGVSIAQGAPLSACDRFDLNSDGRVAINELIAAVTAALYGCGVEPPTPRPTPTITLTRTVTATPTATVPPTESRTPTETPTPAATGTPTRTGTRTNTPTRTRVPTKTPRPPQSQCGGFVTLEPVVCRLAIKPAVVSQFGSFRVSYCLADLDGDVVGYCLAVSRAGSVPAADCFPLTPPFRLINLCVETDPISAEDFPRGDYRVAIDFIDLAGNVSDAVSADFSVR